MIDSFSGEYRFLSNFAISPIVFGNFTLQTVEHGYQGMKTKDLEVRKTIFMAATAGEAKRLGQAVDLRDDWEQIKVPVMKYFLDLKFSKPDLCTKLIATGDQELIEGNTWNDTFWGVCQGKGKNMLGKLLMAKRQEILLWA